MAIKKVNFRGISRTPSDRGTEDGGLAESLNMILEGGELKPASVPEELTGTNAWSNYGLPPSSTSNVYDILYIHKMPGVTKFICKKGSTIGLWARTSLDSKLYIDEIQGVASIPTADLVYTIETALAEYGYVAPDDLEEKLENFEEEKPVYLCDCLSTEVADIEDSMTVIFGEDVFTLTSTGSGTGYRYDLSSFGITLETGEAIDSVTSIGNTLVISTNKHLHYVLYKDGAYSYLGTKVPMPELVFAKADSQSTFSGTTISSTSYPVAGFNLSQGERLTVAQWEAAVAGVVTPEETANNTSRLAMINEVTSLGWGIINQRRATDIIANRFPASVLVRYAVKLYDGSYVYPTSPALLLNNEESYKMGVHYYDSGTIFYPVVFASSAGAFKIQYSRNGANIPTAWSDIISSIDIFVSPDVTNIQTNAVSVSRGAAFQWEWSGQDQDFYLVKFKRQKATDTESIRQSIEDISNFYLVKSFTVDEFNAATSGYLEPMSQDDLLVKPTLTEDARTNYPQSATGGVLSYNERVVLKGVKYTAPYISPYPPFITSTAASYEKYTASFLVRDSLGVTRRFVKSLVQEGTVQVLEMKAFVDFPDARCYRVLLRDPAQAGQSGEKVLSISMNEHPNLDMAFAYLGDVTIRSLFNTAEASLPAGVKKVSYNASDFVTDESFDNPNQMGQSDASNPFRFSLQGKKSFSAEVLDVATITKALSQGQFGQYDLYIFTGDGIWTVSIASDGSLSASKPLSQEIAIKGTVTQIDQAIVFTTKGGVMLLTSSDIADISKEMNGKPYDVSTSPIHSLLYNNDSWQKFITKDECSGVLEETTPFMSFMEGAKALYDYNGKRLIFYNTTKKYQYIYKIDTATWHKIAQAFVGNDNHLPVRGLNSYPDAYLQMKITQYNVENVTKLFNFSTVRNVTSTDSQQGVTITRPLAFEMADVRKVINDLRVRGQYNIGDVQYILLGSMDGISWQLIGSLREGSWKWYRIAIVSTLTPDEALSWIEADVEPRLTNKLR